MENGRVRSIYEEYILQIAQEKEAKISCAQEVEELLEANPTLRMTMEMTQEERDMYWFEQERDIQRQEEQEEARGEAALRRLEHLEDSKKIYLKTQQLAERLKKERLEPAQRKYEARLAQNKEAAKRLAERKEQQEEWNVKLREQERLLQLVEEDLEKKKQLDKERTRAIEKLKTDRAKKLQQAEAAKLAEVEQEVKALMEEYARFDAECAKESARHIDIQAREAAIKKNAGQRKKEMAAARQEMRDVEARLDQRQEFSVKEMMKVAHENEDAWNGKENAVSNVQRKLTFDRLSNIPCCDSVGTPSRDSIAFVVNNVNTGTPSSNIGLSFTSIA